MLGSFISIGFSYAFPKAITVFFKDIQLIFNASYSQVAWISSIMLAVMYAAGELSKAEKSDFYDWRTFYGLTLNFCISYVFLVCLTNDAS